MKSYLIYAFSNGESPWSPYESMKVARLLLSEDSSSLKFKLIVRTEGQSPIVFNNRLQVRSVCANIVNYGIRKSSYGMLKIPMTHKKTNSL